MQMRKTGDRTADIQVGGQPLYPSATAAQELLEHDLRVKSGELATEFTCSLPFTHAQHSWRFCVHRRIHNSIKSSALLRREVEGAADGDTKGPVGMFAPPHTVIKGIVHRKMVCLRDSDLWRRRSQLLLLHFSNSLTDKQKAHCKVGVGAL
ncbi:unnamed protein product [Pleuronectes platessa]|uniref:Uncharacterized protein n=1 Tax=Pleuronectes platessa TaxID=8262 RepID=A0A9N7VC40_PLEPL|nr:unnamed protein product [Pleuronectes platessa]